jgi:hypothetical protein
MKIMMILLPLQSEVRRNNGMAFFLAIPITHAWRPARASDFGGRR